MIYFASQLAYLASIANFGTIISVILIFTAMVIFIRQFRLYEIDPYHSSVHYYPREVREVNVSRVNLPFSMKLGSYIFNGADSKLTVTTTCESPCYFIVCNDVEIGSVRHILKKPWLEFKDFIENDLKDFANTRLYIKEEVPSSKSFTITTSVNEQPRDTYALVSFHVRCDVECHNNDPVATVTLIHLPDLHCNSPPTILSQFLKFEDGRLLNLKPLYSTTAENQQEESKGGNTDCVICWANPATKVLLPCRHACLCVNCFSHVDSCPVCRTRIISHFSL